MKHRFDLEKIRKTARTKLKLGIGVSTLAGGMGTAFICLGILTQDQTPDPTAIIIAAVSLILGMVLSFILIRFLKNKWNTAINERIRENIIERDMLLIAMSDDCGERMPALIPAEKKGSTGIQISLQDRLRRLANNYYACCSDLELKPLPDNIDAIRRGLYILMISMLVLMFGLKAILENTPYRDIATPIASGLLFLFFGLFMLMQGLIQSRVIEVLLDQLNGDEPESIEA